DRPSPCLPNPGHIPPDDIVAPARRQVADTAGDLDYWLDRATGRPTAADPGWYFAGRPLLTTPVPPLLTPRHGILLVTPPARPAHLPTPRPRPPPHPPRLPRRPHLPPAPHTPPGRAGAAGRLGPRRRAAPQQRRRTGARRPAHRARRPTRPPRRPGCDAGHAG